jgi:hypothetical protein
VCEEEDTCDMKEREEGARARKREGDRSVFVCVRRRICDMRERGIEVCLCV